jgi:hypothetical protein
MARSRREQRAELQQVLQSKPQEQSAKRDTSISNFSRDPSPFSQRPTLSPDSSAYRELVAIAAYYRAERRGFAPGGEVEDWLDAEREVAARLGEQRTV